MKENLADSPVFPIMVISYSYFLYNSKKQLQKNKKIYSYAYNTTKRTSSLKFSFILYNIFVIFCKLQG